MSVIENRDFGQCRCGCGVYDSDDPDDGYTEPEYCLECGGTGEDENNDECGYCDGSGDI